MIYNKEQGRINHEIEIKILIYKYQYQLQITLNVNNPCIKHVNKTSTFRMLWWRLL